MRAYGRHYSRDERDQKLSAAQIHRIRPERAKRYWHSPWLGDQGELPECVGYAWSSWLWGAPVRQWLDPSGIYQLAQGLDEWEGTDYEGTSVRAGAKLLHRLGFIQSYHWATSVEAVARAVLELGPVVVGTDWLEGMIDPTPGDHIITATGESLGGHAWVIDGVNTNSKQFRMRNSWGPEWGDAGRARISFTDLHKLLRREGEACIALERRAGPVHTIG